MLHLAGALDDGLLDAMTPERLRAVLGPKWKGASHLSHALQDVDHEALVLFSSMAGMLGNAGRRIMRQPTPALRQLPRITAGVEIGPR